MRKAFNFIVLFWLMAFSQVPSFSLTVSQPSQEFSLSRDIRYWEDKTGKASLASATSALNAGEFMPIPPGSDVLNLGFTQSAYWISISLNRTPKTAENWVLEIPYLGINQVNLFAPGEPPLLNGSLISVENRPVYSRFYAFPVYLDTHPTNYFLRVSSTYPISLPLRLVELRHFYELQAWENLFQFLYFGGLISLLIYNLMLFVMIRDDKYIIYSLFTLLTGVGIFAGNGYASIYLWPESPYWDAIAQPVFMSLAGGVGVLFSTRFLKTRRFLPKTHRALRVLMGSFAVLAVLIVLSLKLPIPQPPLFHALFFVSLITPIVVSAACIRNIRYNIRSARFFLAAWGILCLGVFVAAARVFNLVPSNPLTLYVVQISSGLEMLLFSLALAYRIQSERNLRENAQAESLAAKQVALDALRISEDRLEEAVVRRTEKLQHLLISEQEIHAQYVRFGAMIAHEFRNPLNIIEGQTSMLELESESGIDNTQKRTRAIRSATFRLANLFDQWLQSDRLNQPGTHIDLAQLEVGELIDDLVKTCRNWHPEYHFSFSLPTTAMFIQADIHLYQIAILNLIDNACKYSPQGSTITISLKKQGGSIAISVLDQGRGIDPINTRRIFDLYYRASKEDQIKGTGLGLAFVQKITELHHGSIEVKSQPNNGSSFTLWLPEAGQHSA